MGKRNAGMLSARVVLRARFKLPEFDVNRTPSSRTLAAAERCAFLPERPLGAALKAARSTLEEMEGAIAAGVASRPALSGQIRGVKEWEGLLDPAKPPPKLEKLVPDFEAEPSKGLQANLTSILHEFLLLEWSRTAGIEDDICRVSQSGACGSAWLMGQPGGPSAQA